MSNDGKSYRTLWSFSFTCLAWVCSHFSNCFAKVMALIWFCRCRGSQSLHLMTSSFITLFYLSKPRTVHINSAPNEFVGWRFVKVAASEMRQHCSCFSSSASPPPTPHTLQHNFHHSLLFSHELSFRGFGDSAALWSFRGVTAVVTQTLRARTHTHAWSKKRDSLSVTGIQLS